MKKGFTLIELLAVIVILAVIALIATPIVLSIINDVKYSATQRSAEFYLDTVNYAIAIRMLKGQKTPDGVYNIMPSGNICLGTFNNDTCTGELLEIQLKGQKPNGSKVTIKGGRVVSHLLRYDEILLQSENYVFSLEELQEMHEFEYYSSFVLAVNDVNDGTIGENADSDKEDAVAGIYINEGQTFVVLLRDCTEATRVQILVDMTINLGGHILSTNYAVCIDVLGGNTIIDGRLAGSTIKMERESVAACVQVASSSVAETLTVIGGTYLAKVAGSSDDCLVYVFNLLVESTKFEVSDCKIEAIANYGSCSALNLNGQSNISNCTILATNINGKCNAVQTKSKATISKCDIRAYSNYVYDGNEYISVAAGVVNIGVATLNDCYVSSVAEAVESMGTLYVNGGTYEGFVVGGFDLHGAGTTSYIKNATIRYCDMPEGYNATQVSHHSAIYIGMEDNIKVYMDNCNIYAPTQPIVLKGSSEEKNNMLYISNSNINLDLVRDENHLPYGVRIDNDTHKLYIGKGCNFTAENTSLPEAVITTNKVYTY